MRVLQQIHLMILLYFFNVFIMAHILHDIFCMHKYPNNCHKDILPKNYCIICLSVILSFSMIGHQVISLDREIEGYNKSTTKEQELNETLTAQLNWSQMDITTSKSLITKKQTQQEVLQAHYSTCVRTLREAERSLTRLTMVKKQNGKIKFMLCSHAHMAANNTWQQH